MDVKPRPVASPPNAVAQCAPHQILVCKHQGQACKPGFDLLVKRRAAIEKAGLGDDFDVSGTACLAGCVPGHGQPCIVGYRATRKATWLFCDIDPDQLLGDLEAFAQTYAAPGDGWLIGRDLAGRLYDTTLARIPAAMIVTREGTVQ